MNIGDKVILNDGDESYQVVILDKKTELNEPWLKVELSNGEFLWVQESELSDVEK